MTNGPVIMCDKCWPSSMVTDRCDNWLCSKCNGHLPVEQSLDALTTYLKMLTDGLEEVGFFVKLCECCKEQYVGQDDHCRCQACCWTCHYHRVAGEWVRGKLCPTNKGKS